MRAPADDLGPPVRQASFDPSASSTHGFLFADLRGYTSYLDRHGALAGAALLDRFRKLVRGAVAAHLGAEIRTEGDSFYVVFPSASPAVACGLDIVAAAADDAADRGDPILVGIGVHAGETISTPEGPVGTAVNIAARLCAMAKPGEVIVSDTVRALTRSVGAAGFEPLGRRSIKGLDDPIVVYRAIPSGSGAADGSARDRSRRPRWVGSIIVLAALGLGLIGVSVSVQGDPGSSGGDGSLGPSPPPSPSLASPLPTIRVANDVPFVTRQFALPFAMDIGFGAGSGWSVFSEAPDRVVITRNVAPWGQATVALLSAALDPPCPQTAPEFLGPDPGDLMAWLTSRDWLDHDDPRPYNVGPYPGRAVVIHIPSGDRWTCPDGSTDHNVAHLFRLGDPNGETLGGLVGQPLLVAAVGVSDRTVVVIVSTLGPSLQPPSRDAEEVWRKAALLLKTIQFDEPG